MKLRTGGSRACRLALAVVAVSLIVVIAGCGGGSDKSDSNVISAGQVDIQLPDGWKVTSKGVERPAAADGNSAAADGSGSASDGASTGDTVPLAKEDPTTKMFKALDSFSGCLRDLGVKFIGAPDPSNPDSPTNDPDYLASLGKCAAKSNIVQAMQDMQKAQDDLTPAQVEEQNKGYLKWRKCMIGRGWGIPEPKPDAKGRLFSFSPDNPPQFDPPPGEDIISSSDMKECAAEIQAEVDAEAG